MSVLFLDLNAYFASVEQQEQPALRGRPIAVCPVMADSSFVIAASYEAKRYGVKTGTMIGDARAMCPDIQLVPAQPPLYAHYHRRVLEAVETVLPIDKVCSIDEMRFRLLGVERQPEVAGQIALRMKAALREHVGECLTASIGIAPNSFLAKLGTDLQKPDGLVVIAAEDLPDRLRGLRLTEFAGINKRMEARLQAAGIFDSDGMIAASRKDLARAFGSIVGERWWYLLRGYEVPEVDHGRKTLGHSHVLPPDLRTDGGCREVLLRLIQKASARLRSNGLWAKGIAVHVSGKKSWGAKTRTDPTQDTIEINERFHEMWSGRDFEGPRSVGVVFYDLCDGAAVTPSLFSSGAERIELNRAVDDANQRFGKNTVYLAGMQGAKDAAQEKIAFNKTWLFSEGKGDNEWPDTFRGPDSD